MITFDSRYYKDIVEKNGYVYCSNLKKAIYGLTLDDLNNWLCVYNFSDSVVDDINPGNTLCITGIGVNKEPHIGTVSQLLRIIEMQKRGYTIQIILGDLDCYAARNTSIKEIRQMVDKYSKFIENLGFDYSRGNVRNQFEHEDVMKTAFLISSKVKESDFLDVEEDIYSYYKQKGIHQGIDFPMKMSILLMFADFIHNGYTNKFKHLIVLSGIDEHLYVPKANEIAQRMNIDMSISGMFSEIIRGFNNQPKMSKSLPNSSISVTMALADIENMIVNNENDYIDYKDSIVFQLMCSTFLYSELELKLKAQHCAKKGYDWKQDKIHFSHKLYELCSKW